MKKVTLQEVATSLGISRTTVWKVFSGHEGVSDSLKSRIIAKAQELGYEFPEDFPLDPLPEDEPPVNIAVAVCRPETSLFWMNIIHQIAKEFSSRNINLVYVCAVGHPCIRIVLFYFPDRVCCDSGRSGCPLSLRLYVYRL